MPPAEAATYVGQTVHNMASDCAKSTSASNAARLRGNTHYSARRTREALREYSEAVRLAPSSSVELASALGNRSAAAFECDEHQVCVDDA